MPHSGWRSVLKKVDSCKEAFAQDWTTALPLPGRFRCSACSRRWIISPTTLLVAHDDKTCHVDGSVQFLVNGLSRRREGVPDHGLTCSTVIDHDLHSLGQKWALLMLAFTSLVFERPYSTEQSRCIYFTDVTI